MANDTTRALPDARSELHRLIRRRRHCGDLTCCFNATPYDCECTNLATYLDPALKIAAGEISKGE